jgi:hypothetical protein
MQIILPSMLTIPIYPCGRDSLWCKVVFSVTPPPLGHRNVVGRDMWNIGLMQSVDALCTTRLPYLCTSPHPPVALSLCIIVSLPEIPPPVAVDSRKGIL